MTVAGKRDAPSPLLSPNQSHRGAKQRERDLSAPRAAATTTPTIGETSSAVSPQTMSVDQDAMMRTPRTTVAKVDPGTTIAVVAAPQTAEASGEAASRRDPVPLSSQSMS